MLERGLYSYANTKNKIKSLISLILMMTKKQIKKSKKLDNSEVIESHTNICELCRGRLRKSGIKVIGGFKYDILKCEKCKHTIARYVNEK